VQAFPEASRLCKKHDIRILYGMTATVVHKGKETPCMLIAQTKVGQKNLFRLVTEAYKKENKGKPVVGWECLMGHREGLLIGASCDGEVAKAVFEGKTDDEVLELIKEYDYIEVQPCSNMINMRDEARAEEMTRQIIRLSQKAGKRVVAVSNAAFIYPEDQICYEVISGMDPQGSCDKRPRYIRKTSRMLEEFGFLGDEKAWEIVIDNPNRIAEMCEDFDPMTARKYPLHFPNENEELKEICYKAALKQYGDPLPEIVDSRLKLELNEISNNGYAGIYLFTKMLTDKSGEMGYMTGIRGSGGASLVAYFCGITDINPIPAHYYCHECSHFELYSDRPEDYWYTGYDIPGKKCPDCGTPMNRDGFNIPFELFAGLNYDKEPDFDLNFSSDIQSEIFKYVGECFGEENILRAGTISTIAEKTAAIKLYEYAEKTGDNEYAAFFQMKKEMKHDFSDYGFVYEHNGDFSGMDFPEFKKLFKKWKQKEETLTGKIAGTKRGMGMYPGGIMILPEGTDVNDITPVQYKRILGRDVRISHLEYHSINGTVGKFDILGHDTPNIIHMLEEKTGVSQNEIPFDDKKVMSLFRGADAFGFENRKLNGLSYLGTLGIPEFESVFSWEILSNTDVEHFSDLMRVSALQHGTDSWIDNAEKLIEEGRELHDVISYRDDIMLYLESLGMDREHSFRIMERVRKGRKSVDDGEDEDMRAVGVPEWYINSSNKIKYLFPKAHTISYVKQAWKIAFYKLYYPEEFYEAVLTFRMLPEEIVREPDMLGIMIIHMEEEKDTLSFEERETLRTLYLLAEARDRGCDLRKIIMKSEEADHVE
nr:PHP domain-containing protein [Lachnospiraceae bacterium]